MRLVLSVILLALGVVAIPPPRPAAAQSTVIDSVDLGMVYRRAVLGRNSLKDQLELCRDDADKLNTIANVLKPETGAEDALWKDWSEALKVAGNDLVRCLRAYKRLAEIAQREIDEMRKRWQGEGAKPAVSARDAGEFNKFVAGIDDEMNAMRDRADQMGKVAQKTVDDANSALAQRGLAQVLLALPFAEALRL